MQKLADDGSLTKKQLLAIVELCNPANRRIVDVAHKLQIGERTLFAWLKLPHFRERLADERDRLREDAFNLLKSNLNRAAIQLSALLESESEAIRLKACQTVIEYGFRMVEIEDIEKRLQRLEGVDDYDE